jgi:ABC-2 type transport system permease protein
MMVIASSACFWFASSWPILSFANRMRDFAQYPTSIFNNSIRILFSTVIPIAFVAFYPSKLLLKPDPGEWYVYLSPIIGLLFFSFAYNIWKAGVNAWVGTGT